VKFAKNVLVGAWLLIGATILMSLGSIWVFMRMAPAIELIIARNERSLQACQEMLASLALSCGEPQSAEECKAVFMGALRDAAGNVTEKDEPLALAAIQADYERAFAGDAVARHRAVASIVRLAGINRAAMVDADRKARQFGNSGAWAIVFMTTGVFLFGMIFINRLKRNLAQPFEEIHEVVAACRRGDMIRRCSATTFSKEIGAVFREINDLLDEFWFCRTRNSTRPEKKAGINAIQ
jgi:hypothetical protein